MGSKEDAHEQTGSAEAVRPSLRNGLAAYAVFSLVTGFLTPSLAGLTANLTPALGASGPHGFTGATPPYVRTLSRAATGPAPTAACPTFVTFASAPLAGQDGGIEPVICCEKQGEIRENGIEARRPSAALPAVI